MERKQVTDMEYRTHTPIYLWRQKLKDRKKISYHLLKANGWLFRFQHRPPTNHKPH